MDIKKISREDMMESIKNGVKEAIHEMMETGDGYTGVIIRDYVIHEIAKEIAKEFADPDFKLEIINGISDSFHNFNEMEKLNENLEKLTEKIESLSVEMDGITTEVYKFRRDNCTDLSKTWC